jgi:hypothetical protein
MGVTLAIWMMAEGTTNSPDFPVTAEFSLTFPEPSPTSPEQEHLEYARNRAWNQWCWLRQRHSALHQELRRRTRELDVLDKGLKNELMLARGRQRRLDRFFHYFTRLSAPKLIRGAAATAIRVLERTSSWRANDPFGLKRRQRVLQSQWEAVAIARLLGQLQLGEEIRQLGKLRRLLIHR